jgi:predicted dehydrogenase
MRGDLAEFWHSQFSFGDTGYTVEATSGTINQQGRAFDHGFEIHLEKATLLFQFAVIGGEGKYLCEPTMLDSRGKTERPTLAGGDPMNAFEAELREVTGCIKKGHPSDILGAPLAQDAILICQRETESLRRGKTVKT